MKKVYCLPVALAIICMTAFASGLQVFPSPAEVNFNATLAFKVTGADAGTDVSWEVIPSTLGSIDKSGFFTAASRQGRGMVRAIVKNRDGRIILGHAMVKVSEKTAERLKVSINPGEMKIRIGQTVRFNLRAMLPDGMPQENAKAEWLVIPADLGTIDNAGNFIAAGTGQGRIVASVRNNEQHGLGQTRIEVLPSEISSKLEVAVTPKRIQLQPRGQNRVSVSVKNAAGNPVKAKIKFSLSPEELGTIDHEGNFTAGEKPGLGIIKAEVSSGYDFGSDRCFVIITEKPSRYTIRLKPQQSTLEAGSSIKFEAEIFGENGNRAYPSGLVWKVIPEGLGSITSDGLFTAGNNFGAGKIIVQLPPELGKAQDAASVKIMNRGRTIIRINPSKALIRPGQVLQFSASVTGTNGKPVDDARIIWRVQPENLGTISPQGIFSASQSIKSGTVIAELAPELGGTRAIAPVTISSYQVKLTAPPNQYNISTGEQILFSATIRDANGNDLTGSATFEWELKSSISGFGTIDRSSGFFTAGTPVKLPAEGYIMVRAYLSGTLVGNDGIKITIK